MHRLLRSIVRDQSDLIARQFPKLDRSLTGYDLAHIRAEDGRFDLNAVLCGSEGTLAFLAEAKLNVLPIPRHTALVNVRYDSFDAALRDAARADPVWRRLHRDRRLQGARARPQRHYLGGRPRLLPR